MYVCNFIIFRAVQSHRYVLVIIVKSSVLAVLFTTEFLTKKYFAEFHFLYQQEYHYEENKNIF